MTEHNPNGKFASKDCGDPRCTGLHGSHKGRKWSDVCPAYKERQNAARRVTSEARVERTYNCGHPQCTRVHYNAKDRSTLCPTFRARENGWSRAYRARVREDSETFQNEVFILPGRCVAWECYAPLGGDDIACEAHAWDFEGRGDPRAPVLTADDKAKKESMTPDEWERYRKRMYRQRKRATETGEAVSFEALTNAEALERAKAAVVAGGNERRAVRGKAILDGLGSKGFVLTGDIAEKFGVSREAVLRDLRRLEAEGLLECMYGGAKVPGTDVRANVLRRPRQNP